MGWKLWTKETSCFDGQLVCSIYNVKLAVLGSSWPFKVLFIFSQELLAEMDLSNRTYADVDFPVDEDGIPLISAKYTPVRFLWPPTLSQ